MRLKRREFGLYCSRFVMFIHHSTQFAGILFALGFSTQSILTSPTIAMLWNFFFSSCCILPRPLLFHLSWKSDSNEYLPMQVCVCALCPVYNVHTLTVRKRVCNVLWLGACFEQCTANRFSTICTRTENSSWFVYAHRTANERMKQKPERTKQNERRIKKSNNNTLSYNWANPEEWSFNVWKCSEWHSNENSTFRFSSGTLLKHGVSVQEGFERFASQADCNVHCVAFLVADIHGCTFILQHYAFTSP